jgi:hypothetical protein
MQIDQNDLNVADFEFELRGDGQGARSESWKNIRIQT